MDQFNWIQFNELIVIKLCAGGNNNTYTREERRGCAQNIIIRNRLTQTHLTQSSYLKIGNERIVVGNEQP